MLQKILGILIIFSFLPTAWSLNLRTDDFAIQLPEAWTCDPDESLVICTETNSAKKKSAIVLINYKKAGPTETLADFRNRLNKPKSTKVAGGAPRLSRVVSFQDRVISGLTWIEALHFEGELPDYYTYFLTTRKSGKFFLISLSAHKASWDQYRPQFEKIISSLQILTPEPVEQKLTGPVGDFNAAPEPVTEDKKPNKFSKINDLTRGMSPAKMFLFGAVIVGSLLVLYALKS